MKFIKTSLLLTLGASLPVFAHSILLEVEVPSDVTSLATSSVLSPLNVISSTTTSQAKLTEKEKSVILAAEDDAAAFLEGGEKTAQLNRAMLIAKKYSDSYKMEMGISIIDGPTEQQLAEIVLDLANQ